MMLLPLWRDDRGTTAIEFGITAPAFFFLLFAIIEGGLLLWTQLGLQHGSEMAARCAGVNKTLCGNSSAIAAYASQQAYGINPPSSAFSVATESCGVAVKANYTFNFIIKGLGPKIELTAQSCFPA